MWDHVEGMVARQRRVNGEHRWEYTINGVPVRDPEYKGKGQRRLWQLE